MTHMLPLCLFRSIASSLILFSFPSYLSPHVQKRFRSTDPRGGPPRALPDFHREQNKKQKQKETKVDRLKDRLPVDTSLLTIPHSDFSLSDPQLASFVAAAPPGLDGRDGRSVPSHQGSDGADRTKGGRCGAAAERAATCADSISTAWKTRPTHDVIVSAFPPRTH